MTKTRLIFIVNGEDVRVEISLLAPLATAKNQALAKSHNTARLDWEIRDGRGARVDPTKSSYALGLADCTRLFLTLPVGLGGALAA